MDTRHSFSLIISSHIWLNFWFCVFVLCVMEVKTATLACQFHDFQHRTKYPCSCVKTNWPNPRHTVVSGVQRLIKIPEFYTTTWFINVYTQDHHWILYWDSSILSKFLYTISFKKILNILKSTLRLRRNLFPWGSVTNWHVPVPRSCNTHLRRFYLIMLITWGTASVV